MKLINTRKWKAGVLALAATVVMAATSVATYAAAYNKPTETAIPTEGAYVDENGELIVFEVSMEELGLTWADLKGADATSKQPLQPKYASGYIDSWRVPAGQTVKAGSFKKNLNETITVGAAINPGNKTARVGIIMPNGNAMCVQGQGSLSRTFTCTSTGRYWVFVQNMSDTTIIANGAYSL